MFSVFLNLESRNTLVIGGGTVASRKVNNLLECGAVVRIVSPYPCEEIKALHKAGKITLEERNFEDSDIEGCWLVFAATNDEHVNRHIYELCQKSRILVNVVDDPDNCNFIVPSNLRRGSLTVSVSTEGKSPLLARKLRLMLEDVIGPEYEDYVDLLGEARQEVKDRFAEEQVRRKIFEAILDLDVLPLVKIGKKQEAKERILQCIYSWVE
ncbi:MAG: bifunctional precorrin-2 dehydrogenase/sirohydrochlorin ferrochelatase [Acidobacteriota bacterium]